MSGKAKWIAAAAALLVLLAGGWYYASPLYTLDRMRSAAVANDADALSRFIDYRSLREDLKAELMAQMMADSQKDDSPFGALGLAIGSALIGPLVDQMVSPAGVRAMFVAKRQREAGRTAASAAPPPPAGSDAPAAPAAPEAPAAPPAARAPAAPPAPVRVEEDSVVERRGLSEFVVRSKSRSQGALVFARHGLGWNLSGVELPPVR